MQVRAEFQRGEWVGALGYSRVPGPGGLGHFFCALHQRIVFSDSVLASVSELDPFLSSSPSLAAADLDLDASSDPLGDSDSDES